MNKVIEDKKVSKSSMEKQIKSGPTSLFNQLSFGTHYQKQLSNMKHTQN